jgi:hypothetical protein
MSDPKLNTAIDKQLAYEQASGTWNWFDVEQFTAMHGANTRAGGREQARIRAKVAVRLAELETAGVVESWLSVFGRSLNPTRANLFRLKAAAAAERPAPTVSTLDPEERTAFIARWASLYPDVAEWADSRIALSLAVGG